MAIAAVTSIPLFKSSWMIFNHLGESQNKKIMAMVPAIMCILLKLPMSPLMVMIYYPKQELCILNDLIFDRKNWFIGLVCLRNLE